MFDNTGEAIRKIANAFFVLFGVVAVIIFFMFVTNDNFFMGLILGTVILAVGCLNGVVLAAFGEPVENSREIRQSNEEILRQMRKSAQTDDAY